MPSHHPAKKPIVKPKIKIFSPSNQTKSQATNPTTQQQTPKKAALPMLT
jgi:hypothetical protein